jgi:hypothetical protein
MGHADSMVNAAIDRAQRKLKSLAPPVLRVLAAGRVLLAVLEEWAFHHES